MKAKRITIKLHQVISREDAEACMSTIALLETTRRRILSDRDAAVLAINERIQKPLTELEETLKTKTTALHQWADANPDAFPKDRKSLALHDGTIGFRTGNPSVVLATRSTNWDNVLSILQLLRWRRFIRVKCEVDKEAILARYSKLKESAKARFVAKVLTRLGLKIKKDETFFVEPKLTELPTRKIEPANKEAA